MSRSEYDVVIVGGGIVGLWTAEEAVRAGLTCCVIEVGGRDLARAEQVEPKLRFPGRDNLGAIRARHHVLTGNSAYWGGGIARNRRDALARLLGIRPEHPLTEGIERAYDHVERRLGLGRRTPWAGDPVGTLTAQEIVVLTGRARGVWSAYLRPSGLPRFRVLEEARVTRFSIDEVGRVGACFVTHVDGCVEEIAGTTLVLAAGVVDTILLVKEHFGAQLEALDSKVGVGLHDHWSLPIARIHWRNGGRLNHFFPPKRTPDGVVGRRLAFEHGFFHLGVEYDKTPPYDAIRRLMAARQRGDWVIQFIRELPGLVRRALPLARLAAHFALKRELYIPDGATVSLIVDFESSSNEDNRLERTADGIDMYWAFRAEDEERIASILEQHVAVLERIMGEDGIAVEWLCDPRRSEDVRRYAQAAAIDAYHLGGGLAGTGERALTDPLGRLTGTKNVHIMSTASFRTPGVANPVLTLLARASHLIDTITHA